MSRFSSRFALLLGFMLFLGSTMSGVFVVQRAEADVTRYVGVAVGDWWRFEVDFTWLTTPYPNDWCDLANNTDWMKCTVLDVLGTNVTFQQLYHLTNGTERAVSGLIDITTGQSNASSSYMICPYMVISANLTIGEPMFTEVYPYNQWDINATISRTYAGTNIETNFLNVSSPSSEVVLYFAKDTGILCEFESTDYGSYYAHVLLIERKRAANTRLPGVAPGQFMHYEVYSVWNDGNDTELESWARNQPMSGINVTVLSVVNSTVTYQEVTYNSTGTVYNYTRDVDVETGSYSYEYLFIAANLTAGDIIYTRDNNTWVNETTIASYLGQQLETNHLSSFVNQSHSSFMGLPYEFSASVSQDFYWHRQSGMLLEMKYEFNTTRVSGMDVLVGHFVLSAVAALSIPPVIPEFPSFLVLPLFMTATLSAVIIYRRKHRQTD